MSKTKNHNEQLLACSTLFVIIGLLLVLIFVLLSSWYILLLSQFRHEKEIERATQQPLPDDDDDLFE